jgi:hypothetical protein
VKQLWTHFRQEGGNPDASFQFQRFLEKVSDNIHAKDKEKMDIELFIRQQNESKEEELKRLSEEMELQIKRERELILHNVRNILLSLPQLNLCVIPFLIRRIDSIISK